MFCPLYKNENVKIPFNLVVLAFDGNPLSDEEFRSADLRNQRSGSDLYAMRFAYKIYDLNNGYTIDLAPNGKPSGLFQDLLRITKSIEKAIQIKSKIFLSDFMKNNWLNPEESKIPLDINGEPLVSLLIENQQSEKLEGIVKTIELRFNILLLFLSIDTELFFGNLLLILNSGKISSSRDILKHLIDSNLIPNTNSILSRVLQKHDIPVIFGDLLYGVPMLAVTKNGGTIIIIDYNQIRELISADASNMFMHEVIHAVTISAINNPKTEEEINFKNSLESIYSFFNKLIPETEYSRFNSVTGAYILNDVYEFAAEFITNKDSRFLLYEKAVNVDKKTNGIARYYIKKFINSISSLFLNRKIFKLKLDEFKNFKQQFDNYLLHRTIIDKGDIKDSEMFSAVYGSFDIQSHDNLKIYESRRALFRYLDDAEKHNILLTEQQRSEAIEKGMRLRSSIANMLNSRLIAIKSTRAMSADEKIKYTQSTNIQISNLINKDLGIASALGSLYSITVPQLIEDIRSLRQRSEISEVEYMFNMHNNFGTYARIFDSIIKNLEDPVLRQYMNDEIERLPEIQRQSATRSLETLMTLAGDAHYISNQGIGYMRTMLSKIVRNIAEDITNKTGSDELSSWISELDVVNHDTFKAVRWLGAKQNSRDVTIRAIIYLINKANDKKRNETARRVNLLLNLKSKLATGESLLDLYETSNGKFTSYLVRYLNYGKALNDYREFIKKVNALYGLPENLSTAPQKSEDDREVEFVSFFEDSTHQGEKMPIMKAWNLHKNEFLARHYERKFKPEYYDAYASLSEDTILALNKIRDRINEIKLLVPKDNEGHLLFDKFYDEDPDSWKTLQGLYIERKQLSSLVNYDGTEKDPNSREYKIAMEIRNLNEVLYGNLTDYHDFDAWKDARDAKILELERKYEGRDDKLILVNAGIHKWDLRNTRVLLKKEGDEILLWKDIDEEIYRRCGIRKEDMIFDFNGDGGAEYLANNKRISNILNLYKNPNTGEVNVLFLPSSAKVIIKLLESRNDFIRIMAIRKDPKGLGRIYKKYKVTKKQVYMEFLRFPTSESYLETYGTPSDNIKLPRWATTIRVIKNPERYVEYSPGDGWIKTNERVDLANPEYERLSHILGNEGMSMIPKESLYKNELWQKIENSETLMALYKAILETIKDSNDNYFDENQLDYYKLPQISGSMLRYAESSGLSGALKYVREQVGFVDDGQGLRQDDTYGASVELVLNDPDLFLTMVNNESDLTVKRIVGQSADGRAFSIVPPRYISPLSDPDLISKDLIGIVGEYYNSSLNVLYKNEIKDKIESLIDMLYYRKYIKNTASGQLEISGEKTLTYMSARKAADMFLYSQVTDQMRHGNVEYSKIARLANKATTAINLGANPAVAITGFFSSAFSHLINSIVGDLNYGIQESTVAVGITAKYLLQTGFGLTLFSNLKTNNKTMAFMELFDITNQLSRKYKKTNQSGVQRFFSNNYVFGMLSATDFIIKSNIMTTLLLSHRLLDGLFVSREDISAKMITMNKEEALQLLDRWKSSTNMWDAVKVVDGIIEPKEEFKDAFEKSIDLVYERIIYVAEKADGVATETQKAEMTTNFIGAAAMIHRQYLPLQYQDRWSSCVYNLDTRSYQQGSFNTVIYQLIYNFIRIARQEANNAVREQEDATFLKEFTNSYKKQLKNWFSYKLENGQFKSEQEIKLARAHRRHVKKVLVELAAGKILFDLLVPLIFAGANDPDEKDELIYQFNAYVARRVEWESMNAYHISDSLLNIRTLTAETSLLDKVENTSIYGAKSLYNVFSSDEKLEQELTYLSGIYKGKNKFYISLFKLFIPYHNTYEQYYGSRAKRRYYENFVMKLSKSEQWILPLSPSL